MTLRRLRDGSMETLGRASRNAGVALLVGLAATAGGCPESIELNTGDIVADPRSPEGSDESAPGATPTEPDPGAPAAPAEPPANPAPGIDPDGPGIAEPSRPADPGEVPPPDADRGAALTGSCAQGTLHGDVGGLEGIAQIETTILTRFIAESQSFGDEYLVFAGEIRTGVDTYIFSADVTGASGFGEIVSYVEGWTARIRIDLLADGFVLGMNAFEGDCGEFGCAQYVFVCR